MRLGTTLLVLLCCGSLHAETAYRWVDQEGKVHYSGRPPAPGTARELQEKKLDALVTRKDLSYAMQQAARDYPVTLYVSGNCGSSCKEGHDYLAARGIPFTEKAVETPEDIDALQKLVDDKAMVPTLTVGTKAYKGWLQEEWRRLLDAAGYPSR